MLQIKEMKPREELFKSQDPLARGTEHVRIAQALRQAPRFTEWSSAIPFANEGIFADESGRPVVFLERVSASNSSTPASAKRPESTGIHLIVLMHGFQGSMWDMRPFQLCLASMKLSNVKCLLISSTYLQTELDMRVTAGRVAHEILAHVDSLSTPVNRVSFVCYSMGTFEKRSLFFSGWCKSKTKKNLQLTCL